MITYETLRHLEQFHSPEGIVSLYLRVEPRQMDHPEHPLIEFKGLLKRYLDRAPNGNNLAAVQREKKRILDFLVGWIPRGRGLAIFTCEPIGLWEVINPDYLLPSSLEVNGTPRTGLLQQILNESPRCVVAVVHRNHAVIYAIEQSENNKLAEISSNVHGWHKEEKQSVAHYQRHIQSQINEHMKKVAEQLEQVFYTQGFGRLIIGGIDSTVKELIRQLPDPLARRLIGTFLIDCKHETESDILSKAREVNTDYERQAEKQLLDRITNAARAGGQGVLGVDNTLPKIIEGRVQTLVIAEGATQGGFICSQCDYLSTKPFNRCLRCGGKAKSTQDLIDRATDQAFLAGAHIETVFGEARDWLLAQGGMGAVLRY